MKVLLLPPDFEAWRVAARDALQEGFRPEEIDLRDASLPSALTLELAGDDTPTGTPVHKPHTSRTFLEAARTAAAHRDPRRWNLLYRILYRLQSNSDLLRAETDEDVVQLLRLEAQVRRDLHTMQAFLRFRRVSEPGETHLVQDRAVVIDEPLPISADPHAHHLILETPTIFGPVRTEVEECPPSEPVPDKDCENFVAWYQPEYRILPLAAPFFAERFAIMRWTILTPDDSVTWDPITQQMTFSPGFPLESAPAEDDLDNLWRTYYASLFTPLS